MQVTDDHKPNRADEEARIKAAGGVVLCQQGCYRVSTPAGMDYMERRWTPPPPRAHVHTHAHAPT